MAAEEVELLPQLREGAPENSREPYGGSGGTQSINRSTSGSPQWLPGMDMVSAITPNLLHVKPRCG